MQTETHDMKLVACVDSTMEPVCLARTMIALERLRQKLARTSTLRHCMELAVLGFDEIGFTIQPLAPLEQGEPLPPLHAVCGQMDPLHRHPLSDVRLQPDDKCDPETGA